MNRTTRPLPPIAAHVDAELARLDREINWLLALSPIHNDSLWSDFKDSGYRTIGEFVYAPVHLDLDAARESLFALPMEEIESPLLAPLLVEKQRELDRQIELIRFRETDRFLQTSLDLFGGVEPGLLELAQRILAKVRPSSPLEADAGIDAVLEAVEDDVAWYRSRVADFSMQVEIDSDLNSMMMVSHGTFYVDDGICIPYARVQPLVQHEIGTHVLTRHNGRNQPLTQLEVGLAHYDPLQEGLGVLAEYLAGYLPGERLRMLAARVVAVDMVIQGEDVPAIFELLHRTHDFPSDEAFDVAVRARRGGGLTKDAVYLGGLRDLVDYLNDGGAFEPLFVGKFALPHRPILDQLIEEGWVAPPELLPRYLSHPRASERLQACRELCVEDLFHEEPCR